jgi:hypothetical protein
MAQAQRRHGAHAHKKEEAGIASPRKRRLLATTNYPQTAGVGKSEKTYLSCLVFTPCGMSEHDMATDPMVRRP